MLQSLHLDFNEGRLRHSSVGALQGSAYPAGSGNMVFFYQHCVVQANAVIGAAATAHRVFLRQAQARQGFARVHNLRPVARHGLHGSHKLRGVRGHGTEQLQEIEHGALGREQGLRRAFHRQHHFIGLAPGAFGHLPVHLCLRRQRIQRGLGPRLPAKDSAFAQEHPSAGTALRIDQCGGQIAAAHVFGQGAGGV